MDIEKLREEIINQVKSGVLPDKGLIELYNKVKDLDLKKREDYDIQIKALNDYFSKASDEEKAIINNLLFILEFLNADKNALEKFLKRTLQIYSLLKSEDFIFSVEFLINYPLTSDIIKKIAKDFIKNAFLYNKNTRKTIFMNFLILLWNHKANYASKLWLDLFDDLVWLLNELKIRDLIDEYMFVHFLTYHVYGNNIHTLDEWRVFSNLVEKPSSEYYKEWGKRNKLKKCKSEMSKGKKKIAFLWDRLVLNSPYMVLYSLIKNLMSDEEFRKNYEIYLYSMSYTEKNPDEEKYYQALVDLGVNVFISQNYFLEESIFYSHLKKAILIREQIIKDEIDYLISGFGYDIPNFIFSNRSAPKQIYWSHGNCTSEVENIDLRISHFTQECKDKEWRVFSIPLAEEFLVGSEENKKKGEILKESLLKTFGKDTVMLGVIGRLIKINNDEYIKTIVEIMKQNQNTIYLACGEGNREEVIEKIKKHGGDEKRFIFTGQVNPHQFGWVIDLYLAPFPLDAGQALDEYRRKIKPYVAMHSKKWLKNQKKIVKEDFDKLIKKDLYTENELKKVYNFENLIPENKYAFTYTDIPNVLDSEDYIKVANRLLKDKELVNKVLTEYKYTIDNKKYDINKFLKAIDD